MSESQKAASEKDDLSPHGNVEEVFETILFQSRFLVLFAVLGTLIAAIMMFLKGSTEVIQTASALLPQLTHFRQTSADDKLVLISIIPAIDYYLFATVLLMFSMGIYELFISEIDPKVRMDRATGKLKTKPSWLYFKTVDDLKSQIGKVIMMILIVNLFEQSFNVTYAKPSDLLYLGGSLFLVAVSLLTAHRLMHRASDKHDDSLNPLHKTDDGRKE